MEKTTNFDPADYIDSEAIAQAYLAHAQKTGDARLLASALHDVVVARERWAIAACDGPALSGPSTPGVQ
jgi:DNA-binding phage protein